MSVQFQVHEFLATSAKDRADEWIAMDPGQVADGCGLDRNKVNKTLFNLSHAGKIELQRGPNGRSIIGYKLLAPPSARAVATPITRLPRRRFENPVKVMPGQRRRSSVPTPHLDEYANAKDRFAILTEQFGELVEATFHANAYAEEGLLLRERLAASEQQWIDMRAELDACQRELRMSRRPVPVDGNSLVTHGEE